MTREVLRGLLIGAVVAVALVIGGVLLLARPGPMTKGPSVPEGTSPRTVAGDLTTLVHGFVARIPGRGSGAYDPPSAAERAVMASAFRAIVEGHDQEAASLVEPFDYSVVRYTDVVTARSLTILAERQNPDGSWPHAWGLYIHSDHSPSNLTVEVPHPIADVDTELVGVDIFRAAGAANIFIAGAERNARADGSADVAHNVRSVFEAAHEAILSPRSVFIQPHGFESTAVQQGYGDLVLSSGSEAPPDVLREMAVSFESAGLSVCLYDGVHCRGLGGTTNVQGRSTRLAGGLFVHLEMDPGIRASRSQSAKVARVVASFLG